MTEDSKSLFPDLEGAGGQHKQKGDKQHEINMTNATPTLPYPIEMLFYQLAFWLASEMGLVGYAMVCAFFLYWCLLRESVYWGEK